MAPPLKRGRPPKGARAMTPTERSREHRARKKPAVGISSAPFAKVGVGASEGASIPQPAHSLADVKLVERLKRVARGEWLDLCELAERLMRG